MFFSFCFVKIVKIKPGIARAGVLYSYALRHTTTNATNTSVRKSGYVIYMMLRL